MKIIKYELPTTCTKDKLSLIIEGLFDLGIKCIITKMPMTKKVLEMTISKDATDEEIFLLGAFIGQILYSK